MYRSETIGLLVGRVVRALDTPTVSLATDRSAGSGDNLTVMEAFIGLAGAIVGGVLAFGASYALERRREKAHGRAARAVMRSQLREATQAVDDAVSEPNPGWPPGWDRLGWTESWAMYRPVLATTMSDEDFDKLARARLQLQLLESGLADGKRGFVEGDEDFLDRVKLAIADAGGVVGRPAEEA
jgi:hypothetical protein